jgi:hypothetical protein
MNLRRRIAFAQGQDHAMIRLHQGSSLGEMGFRSPVAAHRTSAAQCPLWVKSDISGALLDVRYYPQSDHDSDVPGRR